MVFNFFEMLVNLFSIVSIGLTILLSVINLKQKKKNTLIRVSYF